MPGTCCATTRRTVTATPHQRALSRLRVAQLNVVQRSVTGYKDVINVGERTLMSAVTRQPVSTTIEKDQSFTSNVPRELEVISREWESFNAEAANDPELACMHRDGQCRKAVMWYVHHLPELTKEVIRGQSVPAPSQICHSLEVFHSRRRIACTIITQFGRRDVFRFVGQQSGVYCLLGKSRSPRVVKILWQT